MHKTAPRGRGRTLSPSWHRLTSGVYRYKSPQALPEPSTGFLGRLQDQGFVPGYKLSRGRASQGVRRTGMILVGEFLQPAQLDLDAPSTRKTPPLAALLGRGLTIGTVGGAI